MIPVAVVFAATIAGSLYLARKLRQWDAEDAAEAARAVIDDAERIVRIEAAKRAHPSNRGRDNRQGDA